MRYGTRKDTCKVWNIVLWVTSKKSFDKHNENRMMRTSFPNDVILSTIIAILPAFHTSLLNIYLYSTLNLSTHSQNLSWRHILQISKLVHACQPARVPDLLKKSWINDALGAQFPLNAVHHLRPLVTCIFYITDALVPFTYWKLQARMTWII